MAARGRFLAALAVAQLVPRLQVLRLTETLALREPLIPGVAQEVRPQFRLVPTTAMAAAAAPSAGGSSLRLQRAIHTQSDREGRAEQQEQTGKPEPRAARDI